MFYFSTRDSSRRCRPFCEIVLEGLAPDGGLYIPETIPQLDGETLRQWSYKKYPELVVELLRLYAPELEEEVDYSFTQLVHDSIKNFCSAEMIPLKELGSTSIYVAELFCGPTYAFKDVALQFLGQVLQRLQQRQGRKLSLLGATSGDTGGAAIYGVRGMSHLQLTILHPHRAISEVQRKQMCSVLDDNICNIAIKGNFDQCQSMVKQIMERSKHDASIPRLGAINSINWGRILAQMTYYFDLYFRLISWCAEIRLGDQVRFVVPTGNFGNVLAGYFAQRMGLPIILAVATNQNDILHQCISCNSYQSDGRVLPSFAPAMDIVQPSNFERYLWYLFGGDSAMVCNLLQDVQQGKLWRFSESLQEKLRADFTSCCANDSDILQAIFECYAAYDYVLDPHTACAYHYCVHLRQDNIPSICLATAHPAKFPKVYQTLRSEGVDIRFDVPAGLQFTDAEERYNVLEHDTETLLQHLLYHVWN